MIKERTLLVEKIKENLDLLYELDKEAFIEAIEELYGRITKVRTLSGQAKSILFEKGLISISEHERFEDTSLNLIKSLKQIYGADNDFIINEVALFKIYGSHVVPVYFLTLVQDRYSLFENNAQKLSLEIEKNIKGLGSDLSEIQEGKVYFGTEKKFDDFDIVFRKGKYLIALNNFYYSLTELKDFYDIDMEKMLKYINIMLINKEIFN